MQWHIFATLMEICIRKAEPTDVTEILQLVKELALFEKAPEAVWNTEEMLRKDGFGENPLYQAFVAVDNETNLIVGMALYYTAYSTWKGKYLYLDDLIVTELYRKNKIGQQLMDAFLLEAKTTGVNLVKWQVLHWNSPAIEFYKKIGVAFDNEWIDCKLLMK